LALRNALRQLIAAVLIALLAVPAWPQSPQVAGTVLDSQSANMRDGVVLPGSTIFSGETISVGQPGRLQIALPGGGRIEVLADSTVQLNRRTSSIAFTVERGAVSFASGAKGPVETILGDATIRPAAPLNVGLLRVESANSALLAAIKGDLTITTAHDAKSIDLPEGGAVRIALADAPPQGAEPAGKAPPAIPQIALISIVLGAAFLAAFLWIAAHEPTETTQQLASEISPYTLQ
jgi:hypothetical protein